MTTTVPTAATTTTLVRVTVPATLVDTGRIRVGAGVGLLPRPTR